MFRVIPMLLSLIAFSHTAQAAPIAAHDIFVIDGDTIRVGDTTYRLVGYDTPETWKPQCDYERAAGEAATNKLKEFIRDHATLELVVLPGLDRYERHLARLLIDGMDVAELMINADLARQYNGGRRAGWCRSFSFKQLIGS